MQENNPPTVCLNSRAVRRIREDKKLTQLYVAKVVGVTTDTISRWENNRYPSMKTANAQRLAEALEVPLEEILQAEDDDAQGKSRSWFLMRLPRILILFFLFLIVIVVSAFFYHRQMVLQTGVFATRVLPPYAAPGAVIPVRIQLQTEEENNGFILRESFPLGWKIIESYPPPSSLDNEKGVVRWISKRGDREFFITYLIKVDSEAKLHGDVHFRGSVIAAPDRRMSPKPVEGDRVMRIHPFLWADLNGDNQIDDKEMLEASKVSEEMKNVHLDWSILQSVWDAGGYSFDPETHTFVPARK
ncbi:MAG: helix-turn-helix transcriptional regulator [Deltaproteobacteria bacterium]|nr:helix-turn-helix transcriptional regulator [Deltaproteobacteria bacterium]